MDEVYRGAEQTIMWLGLDPHNGLVQATIDQLQDLMSKHGAENGHEEGLPIFEDSSALQGPHFEAL